MNKAVGLCLLGLAAATLSNCDLKRNPIAQPAAVDSDKLQGTWQAQSALDKQKSNELDFQSSSLTLRIGKDKIDVLMDDTLASRLNDDHKRKCMQERSYKIDVRKIKMPAEVLKASESETLSCEASELTVKYVTDTTLVMRDKSSEYSFARITEEHFLSLNQQRSMQLRNIPAKKP